MPSLVYFLVVISLVSLFLCLSMLSFLLWKSQSSTTKLTTIQFQEIQRLSNLVASKEMTTFSTLQTLTPNNLPVDKLYSNVDPNFIPKDDASMAKYLEKQYREAGIDPNAAYDSPEEAIKDFGIF